MLPFTSIGFFIVSAILVVIALIVKRFASRYVKYNHLLLIISSLYVTIFYPYPVHVAVFVVYSYLVYYLFSFIIKFRNKLTGIIVLLLPMILVKSDVRFHFYPFTLNSIITFAGLSYMSFRTVQLYIDTTPDSKRPSLLSYINFLIFFPTILIGPIDRYERFNGDLKGGYGRINNERFLHGLQMIVYGILHKYIIAELISRYLLFNLDPNSKEIPDMLGNMYAYSAYLYFDFAGYSAMAIGLGALFGIDVPINFNKPFLAKDPSDFWRRFHKSLGDWLKDYFFRPMYMYLSRKKSLKRFPLAKQNVALFMTFLLMGLWNGFQSFFIISGAIFGIYSVVHNTYMFYSRKKKRDIVFGKMSPSLKRWISIFIMFNLACFAIYIFSGRFPFLN